MVNSQYIKKNMFHHGLVGNLLSSEAIARILTVYNMKQKAEARSTVTCPTTKTPAREVYGKCIKIY